MNHPIVLYTKNKSLIRLVEKVISHMSAVQLTHISCDRELIKKIATHTCTHAIIDFCERLNLARTKDLSHKYTHIHFIVPLKSRLIKGLSSQISIWQYEKSESKLVELLNGKNHQDLLEKIPALVSQTPKMIKIAELIKKVSLSQSHVLLTGESGTGKEVLAQEIHNRSHRGTQSPWVALNCAAIPSTLLESELFGYAKGAFTGATQNRKGKFEIVGKGTLFLDEITELDLGLQAKLLRVIQTRQFESLGEHQTKKLESRIICASNRNIEEMVQANHFRQDLYYRLNVIRIEIPPLRERTQDIPLISNFLLKKFNQQNSTQIEGFHHETFDQLMNYDWPGNIRELSNLIERVTVIKEDISPISPQDLENVGYYHPPLDQSASDSFPINLKKRVSEFEAELICSALEKSQGNKNKAAKLLNIKRTTLIEKLKRIESES